jgi:SAM-dependent methyltransferase
MLAAMAGTADHVPRNRAAWDRWAAEYAGPGLRNWAAAEPARGIWNIAEAQAGVLPADLEGRDSSKLGCGTGYVSAWLARRGSRPAGLDNSAAQLATARQLQDRFGLRFPLIPLIVRCARPADLRRQAGTAFPPCGGKAAANPVIRELQPCCLRHPGPLSRHAGAPGRRCLARRSRLRRLAARDGGSRSGHAAAA